MSAELDALQVQVDANRDVEESAVILINGIAAKLVDLAAQLTAAGIDATKVTAMATELQGSASDLGAAVAANTTPTPPQRR